MVILDDYYTSDTKICPSPHRTVWLISVLGLCSLGLLTPKPFWFIDINPASGSIFLKLVLSPLLKNVCCCLINNRHYSVAHEPEARAGQISDNTPPCVIYGWYTVTVCRPTSRIVRVCASNENTIFATA